MKSNIKRDLIFLMFNPSGVVRQVIRIAVPPDAIGGYSCSSPSGLFGCGVDFDHLRSAVIRVQALRAYLTALLSFKNYVVWLPEKFDFVIFLDVFKVPV